MFQNYKFVLASESARRKILLSNFGLKFKIAPSSIEEVFNPKESITKNVKRIALEKAISVSTKYSKEIIISADTIVVLNKKILGKPKNKIDAIKMLKSLSGKKHIVYTAFAILNSKTLKHVVKIEKTFVTFNNLEKKLIVSYVLTGSPMDKAGAYGVQDDFGAVFVKKINGCYNNVVGFPLQLFYTTLKEFLKNGKKN